ncbi:hypothetical protein [Rhodopirellula sp. P2]|uniref:hypothetical protein n=1 Tax=Rhodopirellula sp. P2 TaxID=2127060 RepID=UPI0023685D52|nr:hypothetical protein [Rhodopirellula sp. P2]WDQ16142.1 hypothetical protein PSR62_21290 [Rhodopirellula sp. P2]
MMKPASLPNPWLWCAWLMLVPLLAGCDGCRQAGDVDLKEEVEQQKLPPFTISSAKAFPATRPDAGTKGATDGAIKPGHWFAAGVALKSNREDERGVIQTETKLTRPVDAFADTVEQEEIEQSLEDAAARTVGKPFRVRRPAVLPRGQRRELETRALAPEAGGKMLAGLQLDGDFVSSRSGSSVPLRPSIFAALPTQSFFFVVLTERSERFTRLQTSDWVEPLRAIDEYYRPRENYRIVIPATQGVLPLSETMLDWSSTAVLFWDDLTSSALTPGQRNAIVDWVHFGGTLIVNGPSGTDAIEDPNLKSLLPIQPDGNEEINSDNAIAFLKSHQVSTDESLPAIQARLTSDSSTVVVAGQPASDATSLGDGDLVYQRRVGRGRIVHSRVDLLSEWMTAWKSYDSFFNSAVLARPPRRCRTVNSYQSMVPRPFLSEDEIDTVSEEEMAAVLNQPSFEQKLVGMTLEDVPPSINSSFRLFTRDMRLGTSGNTATGSPTPGTSADEPPRAPVRSPKDYRNRLDSETLLHPVSGVGGWKDDSPVLTSFRNSLQERIGVTIPDSSLVVKSLLIYLVVLIPLNYAVFRWMGRLEWAWLAMIPIALVGAFMVARAAQLDMGFARSRNELALLEIPREHDRGHLTRTIALYNSLASNYSVQFETPDAAITMLTSRRTDSRNANMFGSDGLTLQLGFEAGPRLDGIAVGSNSFAAVHTEQMVSVGGPLSLSQDGRTLRNDSNLDLTDVYVIHRPLGDDATSKVEIAVLGGVAPGESPSLSYQPAEQIRVASEVDFGIRQCMQRILTSSFVPPGTTRLLGRLASIPPDQADADESSAWGGLEISPQCSQVNADTIVLAHLEYSPLHTPQPDENLADDFRPRTTKLEEEKRASEQARSNSPNTEEPDTSKETP